MIADYFVLCYMLSVIYGKQSKKITKDMTRTLTQVNAYQVGIFQGPLLVLGIL